MQMDRVARYCQVMATCTLVLMLGMLLLNVACWVYPGLVREHGLGFNLTAMSLAGRFHANIAAMPWWQWLGGMLLSCIPLLVLCWGLYALRRLFCIYGTGTFFSEDAALLLGRVGRSVAIWVLVSLLLEPVMSVWVTLLLPPGQRLLSVGFDSAQLVSLFLAAAVCLIAHIHREASALARENQQFI